jgi:hypothetical protein
MSTENFVALWTATMGIWAGVVFAYFVKVPKPQMVGALTFLGWLSIPTLIFVTGLIVLTVFQSEIVQSMVWQWGTIITGIALIVGAVFFLVEGVQLVKAHVRRN